MIQTREYFMQLSDDIVHLKVTQDKHNVDVYDKKNNEHFLRVFIRKLRDGTDSHSFSIAAGTLWIKRGLITDKVYIGDAYIDMSLCLSRFRPYSVELATKLTANQINQINTPTPATSKMRYIGKAYGKKKVVVHNVLDDFACELFYTNTDEIEVRVDRRCICVYHAMLMLLPVICKR